jgi:hypothetical protein
MPRITSPPVTRRQRLPGCFAVAAPLLLAGLLPLHPEVSGSWGWSGSWVYPVGDPYALSAAPADGGPPYRVLRGVSDRDQGGSGHQGADLSNGRAGGPVRAAGNGLVVAVGGKGWNHGYGRHVVVAHRFLDGGLVYSLYAHLAAKSVTVRPGQLVSAGRVIGRVGMTGRATSPHLHFELRAPGDSGTGWEHAPVVDPLGFVAARRAAPRADSSWANPYLEWAECAALIRPGDPGDRAMSRMEWWRALAAATRQVLIAAPADDESLRRALVDSSLLPEDVAGDAGAALGWSELARDLRRARELGLRLPSSPVRADGRRADCRRQLGLESPAQDPGALGQGRAGAPSRAEVCLALADLSGDAPPAPRVPKRKAVPPPAG